MIQRAAVLVLGLMTGLWSLPGLACPGCQNPNLPMTRSSGVLLKAGAARVGAQLGLSAIEVIHESGCRGALESCIEIPQQPLHFHEQWIVPAQLTGIFEYGLTDTFAIEGQLPLRSTVASIEYSDENGDAYEPVEGNIHHRNEVLVGLGDPELTLRGSWVFGGGWWFIVRAGSSLPIGRTEPDPFKAGDNLEEHQHVQFGTGTFDPVLGLELARSYGRLQGTLYSQFRTALYENSYGFQAGARTLVGLQGGYRFAERAVSLLSVEYMRDAPERWSGEIQQDGILGRQEILLGASVGFSFGGPQYNLALRTPLFREIFQGEDTEAGEIFAPLTLSLGIQFSL